MDVVYIPSSAIVYAGDCGTVGYPSQGQIVTSWVLCNPAKLKSQIALSVLKIVFTVWLSCGI